MVIKLNGLMVIKLNGLKPMYVIENKIISRNI